MDPFTRLPPELIVQILHLADFSAVQNIISVLDSVRAVLRAQPTVIQGLIRSDSMASLPEIQKLCLNTALLQTSNSLLHSRSLLDYQQKYGDNPTIEYTEELSTCILELAPCTQRLACACPSLIQHKMVSALAQSEDPKISTPDRIQRAREPFSFTEEYRVYCSIWHLQHYSTLPKAATECWNWNEASIQGLDAYNTWNEIDWRTGTERIWTTAALLSDLGLAPIYRRHPFQHLQKYLAQDPEGEESSRAAWTFPHETPLPLFHSFDAPLAQHTRNPPCLWTPLPRPRKTNAMETWQLTIERRRSLPLQCMLFYQASSAVSREREPSSPALADFRPWRRLGVAIWDAWRMHLSGLFTYPGNPGRVIPTPDGDTLDVLPRDPEEEAHVPLVDYWRWLASIKVRRAREYTRDYTGGVWRRVET